MGDFNKVDTIFDFFDCVDTSKQRTRYNANYQDNRWKGEREGERRGRGRKRERGFAVRFSTTLKFQALEANTQRTEEGENHELSVARVMSEVKNSRRALGRSLQEGRRRRGEGKGGKKGKRDEDEDTTTRRSSSWPQHRWLK